MLHIDLDVDLNADLNVGLSSPDLAQLVATEPNLSLNSTQLTNRFEVLNSIAEDNSYVFFYNFCKLVLSHC
jgi:hypothetical protein